MAYAQRAFVVQWDAAGTSPTITPIWGSLDLDRSAFGGDVRAETDIRDLYITLYEGQSVAIDSFMHIWAGWADTVTGAWDPARRPYAGVIIDHEGFMEAGEHVLHVTCTGYSDYGGTTRILGWPVADPNAIQTGVDPGYSVAQWISGAGLPGLITAHFTDLVQVTIVPGVGDLVLDAAHLPGIVLADFEDDAPAGAFGFVYVQDAIEEVLKAAHAVNTGVRPLAFWRPTIHPTQPTWVVPNLVIIDLNDTTGTVVATVHAAQTLSAGEVLPEDTRHHRDARKAYQRIVTKGNTGDPTFTSGRHDVFADYTDSGHLATYPDPFRLSPGRALILHERTLETVAEATNYAARVETQVWAPRGTLTCTLYDADLIAAGTTIDALQVGALLHYIDAKETLDQNYPIISVQRSEKPGERSATVTFGFVPLDLQDIDVGGTGDMPWLYDGTNPFVGPNAGGGGVSTLAPNGGALGQPAPFPLITRPTADSRNTLRGRTKDVIPLVIEGTDQARPAGTLGPSIDADIPLPTAAGPLVQIRPRKTLRTTPGVPGAYYDTYGFWQPNVWFFEFTTTDPIHLLIPRWLKIRVRWEDLSAGAVTYQKIHGGTTSTVTVPFDLDELDTLVMTAASIPGAGYLLLTLTTAEYGGAHL